MKPSNEQKWSETSTQNLLHAFYRNGGVTKDGVLDTNETKAELAMATRLEGCAVADAGRTFCQGCYILEGDSPLILLPRMFYRELLPLSME